MKTNQSIIKKVFNLLKKYNIYIILSLLISIIIVASTLIVPILVGNSIDVIVDKNNVDFVTLKTNFIYIFILISITAIAQWILSAINNHITYEISRKLRCNLMAKIQRLPLSYLDTHYTGEIVSTIINDVETFSDGLLLGFSQLFTSILTVIATLGIMIYYNLWIALVVFLLTPISIFISKYISTRVYSKFKEQANLRASQTAFIESMINNQKVVHAFNHQQANLDDFDKENEELSKVSLKANFYSSLTNPLTRFVNAMVYAAVAIFGTILIVKGNNNLTIGTLTIFLSYASQYAKPFNEISSVITEMQNAFACANRIFNLLEEKEMPDESSLKEVNLLGNVSIKNVSFSYVPEKPLIENFNIEIKQGQKIAIVGPTGCGKTTMINLLMKFYRVNQGNIYFDGVGIDEINKNSLRNNIGMVLQDTWLKSGTIKENICFGKNDASKEEIDKAITLAHCKSFIEQLPNGIDTEINEDGGMLSQGQKQLLCIARLMLVKPPILILDEATSNIDTRTEIKIQKAFNELMKNKTSFIVAHRLSTIKNADIIIVMKDGHILETGNHDELISKKGFYYDLYMSQFEQV